MTDKEVNKLKRAELLELLFGMRKEIDRLLSENESLKQRAEIAEDNRELLKKIYDKVCGEEKMCNEEKEIKDE